MMEIEPDIQIAVVNGGYVFCVPTYDAETGEPGMDYFTTSSLENLLSMVRSHLVGVEDARRNIEAIVPVGD